MKRMAAAETLRDEMGGMEPPKAASTPKAQPKKRASWKVGAIVEKPKAEGSAKPPTQPVTQKPKSKAQATQPKLQGPPQKAANPLPKPPGPKSALPNAMTPKEKVATLEAPPPKESSPAAPQPMIVEGPWGSLADGVFSEDED